MTWTETLESIIMWSLKWDTSCAALFRSQSKLHLFILLFLPFLCLHRLSHNSQFPPLDSNLHVSRDSGGLRLCFSPVPGPVPLHNVIQYLLNEWQISSGNMCWLIGSYWENWLNCSHWPGNPKELIKLPQLPGVCWTRPTTASKLQGSTEPWAGVQDPCVTKALRRCEEYSDSHCFQTFCKRQCVTGFLVYAVNAFLTSPFVSLSSVFVFFFAPHVWFLIQFTHILIDVKLKLLRRL